MTTSPDHGARFILDHAVRLITVSFRCIVSFGLADGLNSILLTELEPQAEWRQPVAGFHRDTLLMAALRTAILLDADARAVSFQAVYHRLKDTSVRTDLLQFLADRFGDDDFATTRRTLIEEFLDTYREIDWKVHGRLTHFRNRGIAHLSIEQLEKSVTLAEIRDLVDIISRLAVTLRDLCQVPISLRPDVLDEYCELAKKVIRGPRVKPD